MDEHQDLISDFMFALLHKAIEDKEYLRRVCEYRANGGTVFLDNSCFELGASLDNHLLNEYFEIIRPDVVVLPDVLGDKEQTFERTTQFLKDYPQVAPYSMAVIQGSSPEELIDCYNMFMSLDVRIPWIGIPFVYSWVERDPRAQADERIRLMKELNAFFVDTTRNHHLLGTWQAREFSHYREYDWVRSIDTSNPVMAALDGVAYGDLGLESKPKSTFDSTYHMKESDIDMDLLYNNVRQFGRIVHGY
jgi:hypothetical protein